MKKSFKKAIISVLIFAFFTSVIYTPHTASAKLQCNKTEDIIDMGDGDYIIVETSLFSNPENVSTYSTVSTISPNKMYKYYNANNELCWIYTLYATFKYDGSLVACTNVSSTAAIYKTTWSFVSKDVSKSGGTASGTVHMKTTSKNVSKTLTITCTKNGSVS